MSELVELYAEYGDCLDEGDLERWVDLFTEDASYRLTSRENHDLGLPLALVRCEGRAGLRDRAMAIGRTAVFRPRRMRHLIGAPRVVAGADDDTIASRATFAVFETIEGEETRVFLTGRSFDRVVREGGRLRFRERVCVFDASLVPGSIVYPL
ncbi:MAG TPA: nuclear transport factor 2 family protein [Candidatus Binatia bacterium]|nr:nuclear transport factor 2 family protein [Candidatus Binatia bacterium]